MGSIRWNSLVAAFVLLLGASPLSAESPLEELEAKLSEQAKKIEGQAGKSAKTSATEESLPLPRRSVVPKAVEIEGFSPSPAAKTPTSIESIPGSVDAADPPYLGLTLELPTDGQVGLRVIEVIAQSPAWKSGFRIEDAVLAVGGKVVSDIDSFAQEISRYGANEPITFLVERRNRQMELVAVMLPRSIALRTQPNGAVPPPSGSGRAKSSVPGLPSSPRVPQILDGKGNIGLVLAPLSDAFRRTFGIPVFRGASVLEVAKDSPAHAAGLAAGDCIVEIDGNAILSEEDVSAWKNRAQPLALAAIAFYRGPSKMQTMLQVPSDGALGNPVPIAGWDPSKVTPEMLTPEYVSALQAELANTRTELQIAKEMIERLEKRSGSR